MLIPIIKESDFRKELEWAAKVYGNTLHKHLDEIVDKHDSSQLALLEGLKRQGEEIIKSPAYINLTTEQGQCDDDGVMIAVSRQALDETITAITKHFSSLEESITYLKSIK